MQEQMQGDPLEGNVIIQERYMVALVRGGGMEETVTSGQVQDAV
jgi:hypothetical protein